MKNRMRVFVKGYEYVDFKRVLLRGGAGGNGCVSWHQEPFTRGKRADGADGGDGGRVVFVADEKVLCFKNVPHTIIGNRGGHGKGNCRIGAAGKDHIIRVPEGTVIYDNSNEIADLSQSNQQYVGVTGGAGGRGNTGGNPRTRVREYGSEETLGLPGEERRLELELKTIADVGLVGLPNAGKSTFLNAISNAKSKTAPYLFTTLTPHLGTIFFEDHYCLKVADIPGIIVGAADNVGLGVSFLRHIERCKVLLYILDMSSQEGVVHPVEALRALKHEIRSYSPEMLERPALIAANKMDSGDEAWDSFKALKQEANLPVFPISALRKMGVDKILKASRMLTEKEKENQINTNTKINTVINDE
eukprot:m.80230 g.80230  ORF g.80230 m.80230 type:complete len:360 (+) comp12748_c0_seq2:317-1396(+)